MFELNDQMFKQTAIRRGGEPGQDLHVWMKLTRSSDHFSRFTVSFFSRRLSGVFDNDIYLPSSSPSLLNILQPVNR